MNFLPKKKQNKNRRQGAGSYLPALFCFTALFYSLELLFYIWFLAEDAKGFVWLLPSDRVKYIAICLCAVFAWIQYAMLCAKGESGRIWMPLAQTLILPADWILLFHNEWTAVGIGFFLAVQICYGIRLLQEERGAVSAYLLRTFALIVFLLIIEEWLIRDREEIVLLGLVYGAMFVHHVGMALLQMIRQPERARIRFAAGLFLFLLCDIHVAYWFATCQGFFRGAAQQYGENFAWFAMWLFYLPGQLLLVRSNC